jgi:hypothetical protein
MGSTFLGYNPIPLSVSKQMGSSRSQSGIVGRSLDTDTAKLTASYCDTYRSLVLRTLASLEADLVPYVRGLKQVE